MKIYRIKYLATMKKLIREQKSLGSAFVTIQTQETESIQASVQQPIKKSIVGSTFDESK
jgi:hypothetical protein